MGLAGFLLGGVVGSAFAILLSIRTMRKVNFKEICDAAQEKLNEETKTLVTQRTMETTEPKSKFDTERLDTVRNGEDMDNLLDEIESDEDNEASASHSSKLK